MADFIDLREIRQGKKKIFSYRGPNGPKISRIIGVAILVFLLFSLSTLVDLHIDSRWFEALGYGQVFWTNLGTKITIFGLGFTLVFLAFYLNSLIALRASGLAGRFPRGLVLPLSLVAGILGGLAFLPHWLDFLRFQQGLSFGIPDPVFGLDTGFYTFRLPFYEGLYNFATALLFLLSLGTALIYLIATPGQEEKKLLGTRGLRHVGALLSLFLASKFFGYRLEGYDLVFSQLGSVFGAGATDLHARLPALRLSSWLVLGVALAVLAAAYYPGTLKFASRHRTATALLILAFLAAPVLLNGIWPATYQALNVAPDEITKETPFLKKNIEYTRKAYGLDKIKEVDFPANPLTFQKIGNNQATIDNIRILDYRAFEDTLAQQQEMRLYYHFPDVDVDRYPVNNKVTQVLIAPRELDADEIPENARNFNNLAFKYTHGFGLVISPANRVTRDGLPEYFLKDIPPTATDASLEIREPRIYFGQLTNTNVVVNTRIEEFDYPQGDSNQTTTYRGNLGIPMTFLNKLAFAYKERSLRYLLADAITDNSQILYRRNIFQRVEALAPFLLFDPDPYVVKGEDGKIYWLMDAYTTTNYYPYSESMTFGEISFNYIRNSVKVVIDAYSGAVSFYLFDPGDPLARTYQRIYPTLFKPGEQFPEFLRDHIRYPEFLFRVQSEILSEYHMKNPVVFFNKEDKWAVPQEMYGEEKQDMEPYYSIIQIPGEKEPEFVLLRPFTPAKKQNMIAWLSARSDGEHYGELLLYKFPKGKLVSGPMMIESRIDQDSYISKELTLWSQGGSRVLRGNLLVLPLDDALLYVEPLYIIAEQNKFPQLKKVIVASEDNLVMADSLQEGLVLLFAGAGGNLKSLQPESGGSGPGDQGTAPPSPEPPVGEGVPVGQDALLDQIVQAFNDSQKYARENNWAAYGQAQDKLARLIRELERQRRE